MLADDRPSPPLHACPARARPAAQGNDIAKKKPFHLAASHVDKPEFRKVASSCLWRLLGDDERASEWRRKKLGGESDAR